MGRDQAGPARRGGSSELYWGQPAPSTVGLSAVAPVRPATGSHGEAGLTGIRPPPESGVEKGRQAMGEFVDLSVGSTSAIRVLVTDGNVLTPAATHLRPNRQRPVRGAAVEGGYSTCASCPSCCRGQRAGSRLFDARTRRAHRWSTSHYAPRLVTPSGRPRTRNLADQKRGGPWPNQHDAAESLFRCRSGSEGPARAEGRLSETDKHVFVGSVGPGR